MTIDRSDGSVGWIWKQFVYLYSLDTNFWVIFHNYAYSAPGYQCEGCTRTYFI